MTGWASSELQFADLGDKRRNKRLVRLVEDLASQPNASVPQASGDLAATQAAYDFWSSPHIKEYLNDTETPDKCELNFINKLFQVSE